jgi:hypothetical protein
MDIDELRYHAPCLVSEKVGVEQLESRLHEGYIPNIILKEPLPEQTTDEMLRCAARWGVTDASFDIQSCTTRKSMDEYRALLKFIGDIVRQHKPHFSSAVNVKLDSAVRLNPQPGSVLCPISTEEYSRRLEANIKQLGELSELACSHGLILAIENRPRPNYGQVPRDQPGRLPADTTPRWSGLWSPRPEFIGTFGCDANELLTILGMVEKLEIQLDVEHLGQVCQWGYIYNLERGDMLRYGELSVAEKWGIVGFGMPYTDNDVLFDYRNMDDLEREFLETWGYVVREGQPVVYGNRLNLREELDILSNAPITAVTPGFQVYQSFWDRDERGQSWHRIGSHTPGITPSCIADEGLRDRIARELVPFHAAVWEFMERYGIRDVEVEPFIDDGKQVVYSGGIWAKGMRESIAQLKNNFTAAMNRQVNFQDAPYYLY